MRDSMNKRSRKQKKLVKNSSQPSFIVKVDVSSSNTEETIVGWQESTKNKSFGKDPLAEAHSIRKKSIGEIDTSEAVSKTFDPTTVPTIIPEGIGDVTPDCNDFTLDVKAGTKELETHDLSAYFLEPSLDVKADTGGLKVGDIPDGPRRWPPRLSSSNKYTNVSSLEIHEDDAVIKSDINSSSKFASKQRGKR